MSRSALPFVVANASRWDHLRRDEVDAIMAIQTELKKANGGRSVLRRTARLLGITVPTLDRVIFTWRRCRASTVRRVREAIAMRAGQCLRHDECAALPEMGRLCFAERTTR